MLGKLPGANGQRRLSLRLIAAASMSALALSACSQTSVGSSVSTSPPALSRSAAPSPLAAASTSAPASPSAPASAVPQAPLPAGLTLADVQAGVRSATVPTSGSGVLSTVAGTVRAPSSKGRLIRVKVQVEKGLAINGPRFAAFALKTLNDPRGWAHGGRYRFARTDGASYDVRLVLASPDTSARLCRPLVTYGKLSCHVGDKTVLTVYRYVKAIPEYGSDRTGYRHYLVSHEVGHALGHGHEYCPGKGRLAPVMQQQTKGLKGCRPNGWPYP
jgi:Protein of unknown function (DUF3152)